MKPILIIFLLFAGFCSHAQTPEKWTPTQQFDKDLSVNHLRIYILGGIAARPKEGDADFEKKYAVDFYDFGCLAPGNFSFYTEYNLLVFKHLTEKTGTEWEEAIRKDVMAWNQWKPEK
jgi:hypothetical protein